MKALSQNTLVQGRYLIVHMIGKGGMGEVYLAVDQRLGSAIALKRTVFTEDENLRAAFEREAKILGRLRHPVLPKVSDHFEENGDQYLVMEHIAGDDLSKRLEATGKAFPLSWVMFWADQMLDALTYLHSHEPPIIHRDIKPQNLKLTDDNHIVLLDFGLSKDSQAIAPDKPMISASVVGYTPHFASMEQIRGTGTTPRSDIYSFSATFYQLMTNVVPMDALARADAMLAGSPDPLDPPHAANPEISEDISQVIMKGIEVSQDKRYGSAAEMQKELRRAFKRTQDSIAAKTVAGAGPNGSAETADDPGFHVTAPPSEMDTMIQGSPSQLAETMKIETSAPKQADIHTAVIPRESLPEQSDESELVTVASSAPRNPAPPPPVTPQPKPIAAATPAPAIVGKPKSKSRAALVAALVIGLLVILGAAAGGGGWYAYRNYYSKANPLPSPTPVPQASPSPEPTVDTALEPANDGNTNTAQITEPEPDTDGPVRQPGDQGTVKTPRRTQPAKPTTPKAKPKDERTVIMQ
jgi:serine/threonine protein kinase